MSQFYARYPVTSGGGGGGTGTYTSETRVLTGGEVAAKQLTLANTPLDASSVVVLPTSGPAQANGIDFTVSGAVVSWNGLGLDSIGLVAGDILVIVYSY